MTSLHSNPKPSCNPIRDSKFSVRCSLFAAAAALAASAAHADFTEDFEQDGTDYQVNDPIDLYPGWNLSSGGDARVSDDEAAGGTQSLKIFDTDPETEVERAVQTGEWDTETVAFWDLQILPVADDAQEPANVLDIDGALVVFVKDGSLGRIDVFDADGQGGGQGVDTGYTFSLDVNDRADDWLRLSFRHDYVAGTWDLFIDQVMVLADLGLDDAGSLPGSIWIYGNTDEAIYLDDLALTEDNPHYTDTSRDGLPDSWLEAHGLNVNLNQRDLDPDNDGLTNLEEFLLGKLPTVPDYDGGVTDYYYADNAVGDDQFDGLAAVPMGGSVGPKETLSAALASAATGDTILLLPGTLTYAEGTLDLNGKNLRLRPVGSPTLAGSQ